MITTRSPRLASTWSSRRPSSCRAKSLKARVGPWNSSSTHSLPFNWRRRHCVMGEDAIGFLEDLLEVGIGDAAGDERAHHPEGQLVVGQADQEAISSRVKRGRFSGT